MVEVAPRDLSADCWRLGKDETSPVFRLAAANENVLAGALRTAWELAD